MSELFTTFSNDLKWYHLTIQHTWYVCFKSVAKQIWLEFDFKSKLEFKIRNCSIRDYWWANLYHEILNRAITIAGTSKCNKKTVSFTEGSSSYHFCVEYFSQFSFDSEMYTISAAVSKQLLKLYTFLNQMRIGKNIQHKDDRMNSL